MLDVNMIIANNIQAELKKENKKQVDLAEGIGVSKQTMSKIMNGARAINAIELHKISEYLHVSMDEDINTQLENSGKVYLSRRYERRMKKGRVVIPTENEINEMKAEISLWALHTYLKLLSEQIFTPLADADDKSLMYAPFQCMAQYFLNKGYVGIKYKSTVCTGAKDIVLFDKTMATPVGPIQDFII